MISLAAYNETDETNQPEKILPFVELFSFFLRGKRDERSEIKFGFCVTNTLNNYLLVP